MNPSISPLIRGDIIEIVFLKIIKFKGIFIHQEKYFG